MCDFNIQKPLHGIVTKKKSFYKLAKWSVQKVCVCALEDLWILKILIVCSCNKTKILILIMLLVAC